MYPLDKAENALGKRRCFSHHSTRIESHEIKKSKELSDVHHRSLQDHDGMAPLLEQLIAEYVATGLPPLYVPQDE